ncbi:hypothetical protein DFJ73DRAFT_832665 [Zopfochytrium polystomum]|nr:hypothetical protein DFJ73DRAFT_832665 [Zopfochytrium polystomum]
MTSTSSSSINAELESAGGGYLNGIPSWQSAALNITALATLSLSILACVVLVVLVARSRKYATVADRFPLYLATLKLCWSIPHMIDHVYTVLHNAEYPPPTMCTAIGAILMFFMAIELVLTSVMSFAMMLSVMWGVPLNFGRGDVGLWALTCSGPLIWIVCAVYYDAFGADIYWCLFNMNGPHWRIFSIISAVFSIVVVVTPIVCGLVVFRRVQRVWHSSRVIYSGTSPPEDISLQSIKTAIVRKITREKDCEILILGADLFDHYRV